MTFKPEYITLVDSMGDDLRVVNSAKVSFNKESDWKIIKSEISLKNKDGSECMKIWKEHKELSDKDTKLINYLAKHKHWTPFAHCMVTLRIKIPFFIYMQWEKHKIAFGRTDDFVINMISRRYVSYTPEYWKTTEWRGTPQNAKQGSSDVLINDDEHNTNMKELHALSLKTYDHAIDIGICPEQARQSLLLDGMTELFETGSLAGYARLCNLRATKYAQAEICDYAHAVSEIMCELFPVSWKALMEH